MTPDEEKMLITLLSERDGLLSIVELKDRKRLSVWNIAWGYDSGDDFAHVTTNISPNHDGYPIDFFSTSDVVRLLDPSTDQELISFL